MGEKVKVEFRHHHGSYVPGDTDELDADEARALIRGGIAVAATKPDAKTAGTDPEQAATAKS